MTKRLRRHIHTAKVVIQRETIVDYRNHWWTFVGSFTAIAMIGWLNTSFLELSDNLFLIGSFGASSVLVYGAFDSPLAQPRNLIVGHVMSALIGVTVHKFIPAEIWFQAALAVSLSIVVMQITRALHPPGGATALIAVIGSKEIVDLGYFYVISPILTGVSILLIVALIINNLSTHRSYPRNKDWYKIWKRRYGIK